MASVIFAMVYLIVPAVHCFSFTSRKWISNSYVGGSQLRAFASKTDVRAKSSSTVPYTNGTQLFLEELQRSIQNQSFKTLRIVYKSFNGDAVGTLFGTEEVLRTVQAKFVKIKSDIKMQIVYSYSRNDKTYNHPLSNVIDVFHPLFIVQPVKTAILMSKYSRVDLAMNRYGGILTQTPLRDSNSTSLRVDMDQSQSAMDDSTYLLHDRKKKEMISIEEPFLQALKITVRDDGRHARPRVGMADKLRQIQRFVEILDGLVSKSMLAARIQPPNNESASQRVRMVDMGCGLAYLSFAAHRHFSQRFPGLHTVGVEGRLTLVEQTREVARNLGRDFDGLSFVNSSIMGYVHQLLLRNENHVIDGMYVYKDGVDSFGPVDILVALHACDTATDEAIYCGIRTGAAVIVTAPCCQKELRGQMDVFLSSKNLKLSERNSLASGPLVDLLSYGIFRQREADMVTDTLRAMLLEWAGYDATVMEFVSGEHTAKNLMIAAVRRAKPPTDSEKRHLQDRVRILMDSFGIHKHRLFDLLMATSS